MTLGGTDGADSVDVAVPLVNDVEFETPDEVFVVRLEAVTNAARIYDAEREVSITITDDGDVSTPGMCGDIVGMRACTGYAHRPRPAARA